ncbi:response regulator [Deferribacterales bacterium Es71-Z0220]|nr:response regulator [Deferrivibrio essentukiensis]
MLIFDDDREVLENLKELLENNTFEVYTASTQTQAFEVIELENPNVLLLDYLMPEIDGISFLKKVRETNKFIRIILITAFSTVELAVEAIKKGANDFISKPFKKDDLIIKINKSLEELRFMIKCCEKNQIDDILSCLSNKIRRDILVMLMKSEEMRFMDIVRELNLEDHTKLNFHIKNLIKSGLVKHTEHSYKITDYGINALQCINKLI